MLEDGTLQPSPPSPTPAPGPTLMQRDTPEPSDATKALVKRWLDDISQARKHWKPDFDRMRRNMKFAGGKQWYMQKENDDRYRVNLVQRVLKVIVSSLYAKNPTVIFKRRPKLDFTLWDGKLESMMQAQQQMMQAQQLAADPALAAANPAQAATLAAGAATAQALLQDIQQGMQRRQMIDRIGKTLVTCTSYYLEESRPGFKTQMKQMIRRARTTGVGYVKLGFKRAMELSEKQTNDIAAFQERLAAIGRMSADIADGEADPNSAEAAELQLAMKALQSNPEQLISEGLTFDFPASTKIIPSVSTSKLMGWVDCEWVAEEIMLTPDRVKEVYGVDIGKQFTAYRTVDGSPEGGETRRIADRSKGLACVYHVYDKRTGMQLVVCEGYPDFLREPCEPAVFIEQFFPYFAVTFNDIEEEGRLFPDSDVENLTSPQKEFNRSKEAQRQHRIANRPLYASPFGSFEDEEVKTLENYPAHSVIELKGLEKGRPVTDLLAPVQKIGVDPNLYETETIYQDMQRATGVGEANMGGGSNSTATESSIAENSRQGTLGLDSDDLDDMLTDLFRAAGQVLLGNLSQETVKSIAGPGAVWPELSRQDIMAELWLETKAGSSGRPNAAADAAKFERLYPLLVQIPGISPEWLGKKAIQIADDDADLEDAFVEGLQSIQALNNAAAAAAQPGTGNPETDPSQQGDKGQNNSPQPGQQRDNGQPGFDNRRPTN
jgi:hypothetical protein